MRSAHTLNMNGACASIGSWQRQHGHVWMPTLWTSYASGARHGKGFQLRFRLGNQGRSLTVCTCASTVAEEVGDRCLKEKGDR